MHSLAPTVLGWLAEGRPVRVARVVQTHGISSQDPAAAVAYSPGRPLAGELFSGAAADRLPQLLESSDGLVNFVISEPAAAGAGLSCGGTARLYVQDAGSVPAQAWSQLAAGRPVGLLTELAGGQTRLVEPSERRSRHTLEETELRASYWPTPRVLVVGTGQIADALAANAALLEWECRIGPELPAELGPADNVVVLDHDLDNSGRALTAALAAGVGYLGALGSRHTQARRAEWLAAHGVTDTKAIHGPAGLDIGSKTPAEIALSILAEIVSVRR